MASLHYFRWFPKDAETDENYSSMSDMELGFYHRCLNRSWLNEGIPSDLAELSRTMKVSQSYLNKVWPRVSKCFQEISGRLVNPRQEEERTKAIRKSEQASNAVRNRNERSTDVHHPHHYARMDVDTGSGSVVSLRTKEPKSTPNGSPPLPQFGGEFPLTIAEIRKHDPAVDDFFVARLAKSVTQHCLSHSKFPEDELQNLTDEVVAKACAESYATWTKKNDRHGTGLLLTRVPAIIVSWALED